MGQIESRGGCRSGFACQALGMRWHIAEVESVLLWQTPLRVLFCLLLSLSNEEFGRVQGRNIQVVETGWLLGMLTPFVILFFVEMNYVVMKTPLRQCKI